MSATSGPNIVENGLVFCVDPGDSRSLVGEPTTNLLPDASNMAGWGNYYRTVSSSQFLTEFGTVGYRFTNQPSWNGVSRNFTVPSTGTYTFSAWIKYIAGSAANNGATVYVANHGSPDAAVAIDKTKINEWQRISITFNTTNLNISLFLISFGGTDNGTGNPDFSSWEVTMAQLEAKSYATPFANGTRNTMGDIGGFNNIGTLSNSPLFNSSENGSLLFSSASSQQITFQNTPTLQFLNTANYTLESWVYPTVNPGSNNWTGILDRESNLGAGRDGYNLYMNGSVAPDTNVYFGCDRWFSGTGVFPSIAVSNSDALNKWQLLTYTYDGTNVRLYRNAALGASATSTGNITNNSKALTIGVRGGQFFTGRISNTKIYNRALSAAEVKQNFDALRRRFGV